ncbi:MAG: hypothetical protein IKP22_02935, partial [Clostridia bacterium]|nr:hypothetical protein [Clostridia bacterium]
IEIYSPCCKFFISVKFYNKTEHSATSSVVNAPFFVLAAAVACATAPSCQDSWSPLFESKPELYETFTLANACIRNSTHGACQTHFSFRSQVKNAEYKDNPFISKLPAS